MLSMNLIRSALAGLLIVSFSLLASSAQSEDVPAVPSTDSAKSALSDEDVARFTNTIVLIKDFYVEKVGDEKLLDNAVRGMVSGLDPHSEYLDKEAYKTLLVSTSGEFGGLGIEVTPQYGVLRVISPIDDTPASKAGIKAGDFVVAINGKLVSEMTLDEAVENMRGPKGSELTLTVIRKGEKSPLVFKLVREIIRIQSVKSKMLDGGFGYVRISQFQDPTSTAVRTAIENLKKTAGGHLKGLVLDLRNNPGGLLDMAVQITNTFLESSKLTKFNKTIVYTEGRIPEAQYTAKATGNDILDGAPMVTLINGGSASASEIVAGALQDYKRSLIVGSPSFGKGSVQTVIPLDKTHAIKLTTALYHTPSGRVIQNLGIVPDIFIEDFQISPQKEDDLALIEPLKEYQLKNHLPGENKQNGGKVPEDQLMKSTDYILAKEDYQLFSAYKILQAIYLRNMGIN
jgi:carboxyl-terminal processing protease